MPVPSSSPLPPRQDRRESGRSTFADERHCHLPLSSLSSFREDQGGPATSVADRSGRTPGSDFLPTTPGEVVNRSRWSANHPPDEILGPLRELLADPTITEILVTGPVSIHVEQRGRIVKADGSFAGPEHLTRTIQWLAQQAGVRVDARQPLVDARLADGTRLSAMIPPLAVDGPVLSLRRGAAPCRPSDLLARGSVPREVLDFLEAAVVARVNVLIHGEPGSGKTTLLNALCRSIPHNERIITIEQGVELKLDQPHVIRLDAVAAREGTIPLEQLVRQSLQMNPDRVVLGEARGLESWEAWQAVAAGQCRMMMTISARDPRQVIARMEAVARTAGDHMPRRWVRQSLLAHSTLLVETRRTSGGHRRVNRVWELSGSRKRARFRLRGLFAYQATPENPADGQFLSLGRVPQCLSLIHGVGIELPESSFARRVL